MDVYVILYNYTAICGSIGIPIYEFVVNHCSWCLWLRKKIMAVVMMIIFHFLFEHETYKCIDFMDQV